MTKIFTIFDSKAEAFLPPWFLPMEAMAVRAFADCVKKEGHNFNLHPEDYTLFVIGEFDDSQGKLVAYEAPKSLGVGVQFVNG